MVGYRMISTFKQFQDKIYYVVIGPIITSI